jgi:hypothetical protein
MEVDQRGYKYKKITLLNTKCNLGQRMSLMLCEQVYASMDLGISYLYYKTNDCVFQKNKQLVI